MPVPQTSFVQQQAEQQDQSFQFIFILRLNLSLKIGLNIFPSNVSKSPTRYRSN